MTPSRTYTTACACSLPVVATVAALGVDADFGARVLLAGAAAVLDVALLERMARDLFAAATPGADASRAGSAFVLAKLLLTLPVVALLAWTLGPAALALGVSTPLVGAVLLGAATHLRSVDVAALCPPARTA